MATLTAFRSNATAIQDGQWVTVGQGDAQFDILTRGFHTKYRDALSALRREAARRANQGLQPGSIPYTPDSLPPSFDDQCQAKALADHCLLDVRGLTHPGAAPGEVGQPVTLAEFRDMIGDREQYVMLLILAIGAAASVSAARDVETETAAKNSAPASAGS